MPHEKTAGCGINCAPPTISLPDHRPATEWTAVPKASSKGSGSTSTYSVDPNSDFGHLVDKGFGLAKAVVAGVFSIMGLGCTTNFKPSPEDSWEEDDLAELDTPADEVEFPDTADDSEDADALDAEEEPTTIVCEKIGTDVRVTNAPEGSDFSSLAWTGSEFALCFEDYRDSSWEIYYTSLSASGVPTGSDFRITGAPSGSSLPSLVWNGSNLGAAWSASRGSNVDLLFRQFYPTGELIGSESEIATGENSRKPSMVWTGSEYGISWHDDRTGDWEIFFARISETGALLSSNIRITNDPSESATPSLAWTGSEYGLAWHDYRHGDAEILFRRISNIGDLIGDQVRVSNEDGDSFYPSLAWTGSEYGVAWHDFRDSNWEIYFARLSATGALMASDIRITNDPAYSGSASLVWNGAEYAMSWNDSMFDSDLEIFFRRIAGDGSLIDDELRITGAFGDSEHPSLVWTGSEYGISWDDDRDGNAEIYFARVGCHPE
jgi:hypothetical protein